MGEYAVNMLVFLAGVVITAAATWGANRGQSVATSAAIERVADGWKGARDEIFRRLDRMERKLDDLDGDVRESQNIPALAREIIIQLRQGREGWDGHERRGHDTHPT